MLRDETRRKETGPGRRRRGRGRDAEKMQRCRDSKRNVTLLHNCSPQK